MILTPLLFRSIYILFALLAVGATQATEVWMPRVFSDHAVLQRGEKVPVWGTDTPNSKVKVQIAGVQAEAAVDAAGRWIAYLNLSAETEGPHEMRVVGSTQVVLHDLLIGEVWLCSGQSNMRFHLARSADGKEEASQARDSKLRLLSVGLQVSDVPLNDIIYGPTFKAMTVGGGTARINFDHAKGLKTADGKPPTDFAIAGADRKFVWAEANIDGETVKLYAPGIAKPIAVRYDWADAPHGNLRNGDDLPAAPFRTDDYGTASRNNK